ncbi:MAG: hypothetical protein IJ949_06590, partial [Oscillospiraceae bacterium]|nr:hypothetical protein [Oscillospiraceae bacterium]
MNKAEALKCFYEKNKIIFSRCSDETDGNYDKRIASLPEQIDEWLSHIHRDDHSLFLSLLSRYTYLTQAQCKLRYGSVAALLQNELKAFDIPLSEVMFVTVESSASRATGADNVRADLKQQLFGEIYKEQIVPAERNLKTEDLEQYKAIVFLDDIIGSGMTLWKHLHSFCERFSINGCGKHKLFYACIVPRAHGIRHIRQNCKQNRITAYPLFDVCWTEDAAFSTDSPEYTQAAKYEKMIDDYLHNDQKSFFHGQSPLLFICCPSYKYFTVSDFKNSYSDFMEKSLEGFSSHTSTYDIGIIYDVELGLFVIPFYETFCKIYELDDYKEVKGYKDCVKNFFENDKVPAQVIENIA